MASEARAGGEKPLWRKIIDFPLVAMLIAIAVLYAGIAATFAIATQLPPFPGFDPMMRFDTICGPILVILYLLVIRHLGDPKKNDLRLGGAFRQLGVGLLAGLIIFSIIVGVAAVAGVYRIVGPGDASGLPEALIASAIFPAISEEMVFRGVLFRWIEQFGGSWMALFLTSAVFGAVHLSNPGASPIAAVGIAFEAGVLLGAAYMLTRSLWLPMGIHAAWNFTQGEIYDIPVSGLPVHGVVNARLCCNPLLTGGDFGLEASLFAMVVATAAGVAFVWLAIRKGQLMPPMWVKSRQRSYRKL